jgi:hypothetical protein
MVKVVAPLRSADGIKVVEGQGCGGRSAEGLTARDRLEAHRFPILVTAVNRESCGCTSGRLAVETVSRSSRDDGHVMQGSHSKSIEAQAWQTAARSLAARWLWIMCLISQCDALGVARCYWPAPKEHTRPPF